MKKIAVSSLFWKIYLTLLLVLFLPVILFSLTHVIQDRGEVAPPGIFQHLTWTASVLAERSESMPDELMTSWIEEVKSGSGLDIYVRRDGRKFHSSDGEWLMSYMSGEQHRPGQPIVSSVVSASGRTGVITGLSPFRRNFEDPRRRNHIIMLLVAVMCVIFSFMLMKNFMTPLSELRRVTGKLADGEFSVRVGAGITGRSDEIAALGRSFNWMAERVESLVSSQKRLLSDISHEIRSPLQRMEVACALLRKGAEMNRTDQADRKYLDRIELEIGRIDGMVEELLTLARAEDMTLPESVNLNEIIDSIIEDADFECGAEKKDISANIPNLSVIGNAPLLKRAIGNVVHNAIRYTVPEAGIEITARREAVAPDGEWVTLTIRDHGQGVSDDELEKIFLPYYRTDRARERSRGGVGLGLAITKRIIESHGGKITAANNPSGGLAVTLRLAAGSQVR
ncbi:MAG: HAMP domain-containing protein [Synergistaceae bacterium]|nr:HAMP domain-containing protein [Synergistaceae bacterium]